MLRTQHVYVDTEQWRGIRFDWNNDLAKALLLAAQNHRIKLLTTDILKGEIKSHLFRGIAAYSASLKKAENSKTFALGDVVGAWADLDFAQFQERLEVEIEKSMHRYFSAIKPVHVPYRESTLNAVLNLYFEGASPFNSRADKKHEFPDAIALESIAAWCRENDTRAYVVSQDQGVKNYCSDSELLLSIDTLGSLIREMNAGSAEDESMKALLNNQRDKIARAVEETIIEMDVHLADFEEDVASTTEVKALVIDADLILRPSETQWVSYVAIKAEMEVVASGDDPRSIAMYADGKVIHTSKTQHRYSAHLEATFKVDVLQTQDGDFEVSSVEAVGANSILVDADWAHGQIMGTVKAYLSYPRVPF